MAVENVSEICRFSLRVYKQTISCSRPVFLDDEHCIFHSDRVCEKEERFFPALVNLIQDSASSCDLRGFVFPAINFRTVFKDPTFDKPMFFQEAKFRGRVSFSHCKFTEDADFSDVHFDHSVNFSKCVFARVKFMDCLFSRRASFSNVVFTRKATFSNSVFGLKADFNGSKFSEDAIFVGNECRGDALFRSVTFLDVANFGHTRFLRRSEFNGATFSNELDFGDAILTFMKHPPEEGVVLDGAILEAAHIWNKPVLKGYSFREAFLLSLNLADRELINCNFTGAVFKAVLTQGWKPDSQTILNTKFIYTDYNVTEAQDEDGSVRKIYVRVEESRVPAEGTFGEGEHEHFTIADYLKEPLKWNFALNVPPMFRTAVLNYLQFFTDFMIVTQGVSVEIRTRQEGSKIRVEFMTSTKEDKELVKEHFEKYRDNTTRDFASLDIRFNNSAVSDVEKELFRIKYEHAISTLRTELNYTQRLLQKEEEKNHLQEKYLILMQQVDVFSREPQRLLSPVDGLVSHQSQTPIFFLTADLKDYSKATRADNALYRAIQTFLFDQKERIQKEAVCEGVKLEGDAIKIFFRDGVRLVWIAKSLISEFEKHKYAQPSPIKGFRIVLGYGTCYREQRGAEVDFSGDPIVETCRVDQPMKIYIEEHRESPNQIWCTEAFHDELVGKHQNLAFQALPAMKLDKGYGVDAHLYCVNVE